MLIYNELLSISKSTGKDLEILGLPGDCWLGCLHAGCLWGREDCVFGYWIHSHSFSPLGNLYMMSSVPFDSSEGSFSLTRQAQIFLFCFP